MAMRSYEVLQAATVGNEAIPQARCASGTGVSPPFSFPPPLLPRLHTLRRIKRRIATEPATGAKESAAEQGRAPKPPKNSFPARYLYVWRSARGNRATMFYSTQILTSKGPLGIIWVAAHLDKRLKVREHAGVPQPRAFEAPWRPRDSTSRPN